MSDLIKTLKTYEAFVEAIDEATTDAFRPPVTERLAVSWTIGGQYGRSCWGGELDRTQSAEPEPEDSALVEILEAVAPNLTFVQGRRLLATDSLYERSTDRSLDYYGNYTDYARKTLDLDVLYRALREITE